ncbi:MAG TPA: DUF1097 domain-containing protein [Gemmatimonadales bacterium]|jgi:hypothetical protein|nr:DUF1097 domain-containing protein [Gemmatimonadales bacterium]
MNMLLALALSIGVLIAIWTYIALGPAALPVWAGIVAWGCFFAAGGKTDGLLKTIASNLSGVFWAFVALTVANRVAPGNLAALSALVGVIAAAMVLQSRISLLAFIPGAFLGAATAVSVVVGASGTYPKAIAALVAGAVFGYVSELLAGVLSGASRKAPTQAGAA